MNEPSNAPSNAPVATRSRSRLVLLLIFAFFVLPVAVAWVLNFTGDFTPQATANHGTLVQPVQPVLATDYIDTEGVPLAEDFFRGEWVLVYHLAGPCDAACQQALYRMRQVRLAQGKNIDRVKRLLVVDASAPAAWLAEVQTHYPGLVLVREAAASAQFPAGDTLYLVDPLGNLMMQYAPAVEPRGMIKDLERLLRISYIG